MSYTKHLLFVTPGFPASEADDYTIPALQDYVQGIKKYRPNWKISIFTLQFPFNAKKYAYYGFDVIPFNGANKLWKKLGMYWHLQKELKKLNKQHPIDCIHSFWMNDAAWFAQKLARKNGIPHLCTALGQDVLASNNYIKIVDTQAFPIVYLSEFQKSISAIPIKNIDCIIPMGLEYSQMPKPETKSIDILGVGNLIPVKNFSLFVQVIHLVKEKFPNIQAALIGDGTEKAALQKQINNLGLENNIQVLGAKSRNETLNYMAKSRIFLHTSHSEGFCMVLAEASAVGCHVVSTPVGVAADIAYVGHTAQDLAKIIIDKYNEAPKQRTTFPIENVVCAYEKLYYNLLNKAKV